MSLLYRQVPTSSPLGHAEEVSRSALPRLSRWLSRPYIWLLLPAVLALTVFFLLPLLNMIKYSVYTQGVAGGMLPDFTLENFRKFFAQDLYWRVLLRTLGNALITTLLALVLGYPVAFAIARGHPTLSRLLSVAVISPLLVGIVIRTYGWTVLVSRQGLVNQLLRALGLIEAPLCLMGNDVGVIISLLHVFYPFMVIPLATTLQKIERPLEEAAMVLGANRWQVFLRVFVPLSIPDMLAGSVLVFLLTASSFVTTRLIGQNLTKWFLNLLEEQVLIVFDWPFGAALATIFVAILALLITAYHRLLASRFAFIRKGNSS